MNETAGIFAQTLALYSRMIGDREFFERNEPFFDAFMSNYFVSHDWAWMASCAVEWGMGNNIDMLNAELSGWAGVARVKAFLGKETEADFARYVAAKAGASTGARLLMKEFYNSLNFPIPPHLAPVIHEMAGIKQEGMTRNAYLPLGVSQGYGEGWPSLWPTSVSAGMLKHYVDGKDFYSTSKGVPAELLAFYRSSEAMASPLRHYEAIYRDAAYSAKAPYLYSRIAGNAFLKSDRADLENMPIIGFYLQPSVGGRTLPYEFWKEFAKIDNVLAIKMAPFNRYQTFDVVRAVAESGRDVTLYTGNDDNIVIDLLTGYRIVTASGEKRMRIRGGLLGHWCCWTHKAVELLEEIHSVIESGGGAVPAELLSRNVAVTDSNAAFFDPAHGFAGCIPGIHGYHYSLLNFVNSNSRH